MTKRWMMACAAVVALAACNKQDAAKPTSDKAAAAAGNETLATGLGNDRKYAAAIKSAGLDGVLAGPTPYTLLVPTDAAFDRLPAGTVEALMKPEGRKRLTALLSNLILPGTMLVADIGKAIDAGGGKTQIATLGNGKLTATRNGDTIILADGAGTKAAVLGADEQRSNGVIHHIDAMLMPTK